MGSEGAQSRGGHGKVDQVALRRTGLLPGRTSRCRTGIARGWSAKFDSTVGA